MSRPPSAESVFRAIAHPTRRQVLNALRNGERPAAELIVMPGLSKPTLSIHLRVLRAAGLVIVRRQGTSLRYKLNRTALKALLDWTDGFRSSR